jgi:hypothetical protein
VEREANGARDKKGWCLPLALNSSQLGHCERQRSNPERPLSTGLLRRLAPRNDETKKGSGTPTDANPTCRTLCYTGKIDNAVSAYDAILRDLGHLHIGRKE